MTYFYCPEHDCTNENNYCDKCALEGFDNSMVANQYTINGYNYIREGQNQITFQEYLEEAIDNNFDEQANKEAIRCTDGSKYETEIFMMGANWAKMLYKTGGKI